MAKPTASRITIPAAFLYLLVMLGGEPAEAQRATTLVAHFYAAPGAPDNPTCPLAQPCSPQGAVMACQGQLITSCAIHLADGLYLNPGINVFHFRNVHLVGNLGGPQNVVLRATISNSTIAWVQDHATLTITGVTMDKSAGVQNVTGIAGRQHVILDYGVIMFAVDIHVAMSLFGVASCIGNVWIAGGGAVNATADGTSVLVTDCPQVLSY